MLIGFSTRFIVMWFARPINTNRPPKKNKFNEHDALVHLAYPFGVILSLSNRFFKNKTFSCIFSYFGQPNKETVFCTSIAIWLWQVWFGVGCDCPAPLIFLIAGDSVIAWVYWLSNVAQLFIPLSPMLLPRRMFRLANVVVALAISFAAATQAWMESNCLI